MMATKEPRSHAVRRFSVGIFVPPLPRDLDDMKERIRRAVANVDADMLHRVWDEFEFHLDVCRLTQRAHIEHL